MATNVTLSGSVRSNLLALQRTQSAIDVTNSRLNTGKKVNTVIDDAVAYFSAKALDDRASDFSDRKANIDQSISAINTALTATNAIDSLLKQLKGIVTAAKSGTATERGTLQTQYNTVKSQIDQLVADATYQGLNLINNSTATQTTQFSERSASRLVVTAQRLSTYQVRSGVLGSAGNSGGVAFSVVGQASAYSNFKFAAAGLYVLNNTEAVSGTQVNFELVRYADGFASAGNQAVSVILTSAALGGTVLNNLTSLGAAVNDTAALASLNTTIQTTFTNFSGLAVFAASRIFIHVGSTITGSNTVTTMSNGTLWSATDFDASAGLANETFNQALDLLNRSIDAAITQNNSVAKALGTNVAILNTRLEFTKEYVNVQKEGAGKLTLADTNEEGANLVSLQTRQQLGIQALAFAGQTEQSVLRLFG